jgi:hypothetical protein
MEQAELFEIEAEGAAQGDGDENCPCCGQRVRVWKKTLISTAVASLVQLVRQYQGEAIHHDQFTVLLKDRNFSQLKLWGLIASAANDDQSKRSSGRWHPTDKGIEFAVERRVVPKYVITRSNRVLRFEGPFVGVREALGGRFDYRKLIGMQGGFSP